MSQLVTPGSQSIVVSASTSVLSMNTQDWSPLGWTGWESLQSKGLSSFSSNTTVQKHQFFSAQLFFIVQLSHPYMTTGKTIALTGWTFVGKVMSLFFNMLSRLVITFLPRSKQRRAIIKKSTNNKCWKGCGEKVTLLHCWWECKLIQSLLEDGKEIP